MRDRAIGYGEVFDAIGARVIVDDVDQCYRMLAAIHASFPHNPGRVRDYILNPKPNGYQSLHASVLSERHWCIEIQIRTWAMHEISECGSAAHAAYKHAGSVGQSQCNGRVNSAPAFQGSP
jgi:(p)ppGpp synthase/HD superfamily hydrolase